MELQHGLWQLPVIIEFRTLTVGDLIRAAASIDRNLTNVIVIAAD